MRKKYIDLLVKSDEKGHYIFKRDWERDEKTGTMYFINEKIIAEQRGVLKYLLNNIGSSILRG